MPEFAYVARDRAGQVVQGTLFADNAALVAGRLREMGYTPEQIRASDVLRHNRGVLARVAENIVFPVVSGVRLKDLAVFYRQFYTLVHAGIPLYQALVTLANQTRNARLKSVLHDCQGHVLKGGKLSEVMGAYPWIFGDIQIEMIRAAEQGGLLDVMLLKIGDYLEQELAIRSLISRLTLYPKLVALVALFILGKSFIASGTPALSLLIIGQITSTGAGGYGVMNYLNDTLFFLILCGVGLFLISAFCKVTLFQSDAAQGAYEQFKFKIPGIGTVARGFALAKFGRSFGALYAGGLPLNAAVRTGGSASGSKIIAQATKHILIASERGAPLSVAFRETGVFPPLIIDMLNTGEQTGNIDTMMNKAAEYLENEAEQKAHLYANIFAVAVLLFVALMVAYAVISFYMGYAANAVGGGAGAND